MNEKHEGSFLRSVLAIAVPVGLQSMLQSSFSMVDQLMVGQLGSGAVAAVEVAGRPAFIYSVAVGAIAAIAGIMISQYLGMGDRALAYRSLWVNLTAAAALALVFFALSLLFPTELVGLFFKDGRDSLGPGRGYLLRIAWTYLPMGIASLLSVMIRCQGRAVWPLAAGLASAAVNTCLNYGLIFGRWGLPAMGVLGAAWASVISQGVNLLVILIMFLRLQGKELPSFSLSLGREGRREYLWMLLPLLATEFLWSLGQSLNTFIYGHISNEALAAMSITGPVQGLFTGALSGVSQAAGILIGKRLGAGDYDGARRESVRLTWYGVAGALVLSALLLLLRGPYVLLYRVEPEVQAGASALLALFAILAPVKVTNMILGGGILRSGGRTAYIAVIDLLGTWLIGAPLGLVTAFVLRLPVTWVYFILSLEEVARLLMELRVFRGGRWMRTLSRH